MLMALCVINIFLENVSAASIGECRSLAPDVTANEGRCLVKTVHTYYTGTEIPIDAPIGTVGGKFNIDYSWTCLLPENATSNYQQLGLVYEDSFHSSAGGKAINLKTNLDGILFRTFSTEQLAGYHNANKLSVISAPPSGGGTSTDPNAVIADEIEIDGKKYYCGSDDKYGIPILESVKGGDIEPGEYNVETLAPTPIVTARYTTSSSGMRQLGALPSAQLTLGAATCKIMESTIHVNVNDGAPMNLADLGKIQTKFNVPLECSSVKMDIPYKLIPTINLPGYQSLGGIGIEEGGDNASGLAYKIFKNNGGKLEPVDFTQSTHFEYKESDKIRHNIDFTVTPFQVNESVTAGNMHSSIILELDYQ